MVKESRHRTHFGLSELYLILLLDHREGLHHTLDITGCWLRPGLVSAICLVLREPFTSCTDENFATATSQSLKAFQIERSAASKEDQPTFAPARETGKLALCSVVFIQVKVLDTESY